MAKNSPNDKSVNGAKPAPKDSGKAGTKGVVKNAPKPAPKKEESVSLKERWENIKDYFLGLYNELKKVHWPDRQAVIAYTGVVLVSVAIVAALIWLFDTAISFVLKMLFSAVQ